MSGSLFIETQCSTEKSRVFNAIYKCLIIVQLSDKVPQFPRPLNCYAAINTLYSNESCLWWYSLLKMSVGYVHFW